MEEAFERGEWNGDDAQQPAGVDPDGHVHLIVTEIDPPVAGEDDTGGLGDDVVGVFAAAGIV